MRKVSSEFRFFYFSKFRGQIVFDRLLEKFKVFMRSIISTSCEVEKI